MTISHDVVERAARVVVETNASVKILTSKHSNDTDSTHSELIGTLSLVGKLGGTLVAHCQWQQAVRLAQQHSASDTACRSCSKILRITCRACPAMVGAMKSLFSMT